jgi:Zn/Cd-binding protein ZinT
MVIFLPSALTNRWDLDIMTNAWSLLYDEMEHSNRETPKMISYDGYTCSSISTATQSDYQDFWESTDTLTQPINLNMDIPHFWKYEEDLTLKEVRDYLSGTYRSHYTSEDSKTQTLDLIESI